MTTPLVRNCRIGCSLLNLKCGQYAISPLKNILVSPYKNLCTASNGSLKTDILEQALINVPTLGWTEDSLAKAVTDLGLPPLTHRIMGRGPVELVEYFLTKKRQHVKDVLKYNCNFEATTIGGNDANAGQTPLTTAIEAHVEYIAPVLDTWPSALALLAEPAQLPYSLFTAMDLADELCEYADIRASRLDWYTERLLLLMFYGSVEMFLLTDTSENLRDTKDFIQRSAVTYNNARGMPNIASKIQGAAASFTASKNTGSSSNVF